MTTMHELAAAVEQIAEDLKTEEPYCGSVDEALDEMGERVWDLLLCYLDLSEG